MPFKSEIHFDKSFALLRSLRNLFYGPVWHINIRPKVMFNMSDVRSLLLLFIFFDLYYRYLQEPRLENVFLFLQNHPILPVNSIKSLFKLLRILCLYQILPSAFYKILYILQQNALLVT